MKQNGMDCRSFHREQVFQKHDSVNLQIPKRHDTSSYDFTLRYHSSSPDWQNFTCAL